MKMEIEIPYNLIPEELIPDPAAQEMRIEDFSGWLRGYEYDRETWKRVITSAALLLNMTDAPVGACLDTALIWEFG